MLWVWFWLLFYQLKCFKVFFKAIWKVGGFLICCPDVHVTNWNMVTGCFRAAICSQEEGAEKGGCGCCIQDGAQPCRLWLWFFPLFPHLASHSCWENVFTHVWGSRRCQILTATKNTLETNLFLPPRQSVQEASLPTEQEEKITGERVTSWPAPAIPQGVIIWVFRKTQD